MSGQKKGLSYYRSTAERKFKINLRNNFTSPNQNRWFRQKNLLNKLYAVLCDRNGDWWQWSSQRLSSLGYFRFKNILSAFIVYDPARVCDHGYSPHVLKRSDHYRFSLSAGWIYYGAETWRGIQRKVVCDYLEAFWNGKFTTNKRGSISVLPYFKQDR